MTNIETIISATQEPVDGNELEMSLPSRQLCDQARDRIRRHVSNLVTDVAEIGALLIVIKNELEHGAYKKWLDAEVRWSIRTAQNYMNVARNIGGKCETVSRLPLRIVYELAAPALSDQVREELIASITDPENPPIAKIKKQLCDAREQAKVAAKLADLVAAMLKGEGASAQKVEPENREAGQDKPEDRVQKDHLVLLAKSWLFRMVELAPEILATLKSYGAYDVGVAIGAAAEVIIAAKQTPKNPAPKPEPMTPKPMKPQEITLPTSEYADVNSPAVAGDEVEELELKAA